MIKTPITMIRWSHDGEGGGIFFIDFHHISVFILKC